MAAYIQVGEEAPRVPHVGFEVISPFSFLDALLTKVHSDHCIDSIRQSLMCSADISVIGHKWHDPKIMESNIATTGTKEYVPIHHLQELTPTMSE
jgi:hypothetical protein